MTKNKGETPILDTDVLYSRSKDAYHNYRHEDALIDLNHLLLHCPRHTKALYLRSVIHFEETNFEKARIDVCELLKQDPLNTEALTLSNNIYKKLGEKIPAATEVPPAPLSPVRDKKMPSVQSYCKMLGIPAPIKKNPIVTSAPAASLSPVKGMPSVQSFCRILGMPPPPIKKDENTVKEPYESSGFSSTGTK